MLNSINALPLGTSNSHPFLSNLNKEEKAKLVHRLLLDLAKDASEKEIKSVYRKTADFFRETVFGKTPAQVRTSIIEVFKDYFDGEVYSPLEIDNLAELTGTPEKQLLPVLEKMIRKGEIIAGRRPRHNEAGKHYNAIYKLGRIVK